MPESLKTILAIVLASTLVGAAFYYRPIVAEIQNQEKVGELVFEEYDLQHVNHISMKSFEVDPFLGADSEPVYGEIDLIQKDDRWVISNVMDFPTGNERKIALVSGVLNRLKILEVVAENPSDADLEQFGLVPPQEGQDPSISAAEVVLTVKHPKPKDLILYVGNQAKSSGGKQDSYYVRREDQKMVYRIEFPRPVLSTRFIDWVDPNPMRITYPRRTGTPPGLYAVIDTILQTPAVADRKIGPSRLRLSSVHSEPFQSFEISDPSSKEIKWETVPRKAYDTTERRLDLFRWVSTEMASQLTRFACREVRLKPVELVEPFVSGNLKENISFDSLASLGFLDGKTSGKNLLDGHRLVGVGGNVQLTVRDRFIYRIAFGKTTEDGMIPTIIYAELDPAQIPPVPVPPKKLSDNATDAEKKANDTLKRNYNKNVKNREAILNYANNNVKNANQKFGRWIYFVDAKYTSFLTRSRDYTEFLEKNVAKRKAEAKAAAEKAKKEKANGVDDSTKESTKKEDSENKEEAKKN